MIVALRITVVMPWRLLAPPWAGASGADCQGTTWSYGLDRAGALLMVVIFRGMAIPGRRSTQTATPWRTSEGWRAAGALLPTWAAASRAALSARGRL